MRPFPGFDILLKVVIINFECNVSKLLSLRDIPHLSLVNKQSHLYQSKKDQEGIPTKQVVTQENQIPDNQSSSWQVVSVSPVVSLD
jgi:hypothetical protein